MNTYLLTLEITPLEVGRTYDVLPSHLTLMSRFTYKKTHQELSAVVSPLFEDIRPVSLVFGDTVVLGPKKVTAHMVDSTEERALHERLLAILDQMGVIFQYPQFVGVNHKAHVTQRDGVDFASKTQLLAAAAYLIEVVDGRRVIRAKFSLDS